MSAVRVEDGGAGVFHVVVEFTAEECDRFPFNSLCRVGASLEGLPQGGARATASYQLGDAAQVDRFVEALALFGEDGLYARGQHHTASAAADAGMVPPGGRARA